MRLAQLRGLVKSGLGLGTEGRDGKRGGAKYQIKRLKGGDYMPELMFVVQFVEREFYEVYVFSSRQKAETFLNRQGYKKVATTDYVDHYENEDIDEAWMKSVEVDAED